MTMSSARQRRAVKDHREKNRRDPRARVARADRRARSWPLVYRHVRASGAAVSPLE